MDHREGDRQSKFLSFPPPQIILMSKLKRNTVSLGLTKYFTAPFSQEERRKPKSLELLERELSSSPAPYIPSSLWSTSLSCWKFLHLRHRFAGISHPGQDATGPGITLPTQSTVSCGTMKEQNPSLQNTFSSTAMGYLK